MSPNSGPHSPILTFTRKTVVEAAVFILVEAAIWTLMESFTRTFLLLTILVGAALLLSLNVNVRQRWFRSVPWALGITYAFTLMAAVLSKQQDRDVIADIVGGVLQAAASHPLDALCLGIATLSLAYAFRQTRHKSFENPDKPADTVTEDNDLQRCRDVKEQYRIQIAQHDEREHRIGSLLPHSALLKRELREIQRRWPYAEFLRRPAFRDSWLPTSSMVPNTAWFK